MMKIKRIILYPYWIIKKKIDFYNIIKNGPQKQAEKKFKYDFGRDINWNNPKDLNEKIRWLQFYSNTDEWSLLADKYNVRKYIEDKGYSKILTKLYGKWDNVNDIDFSLLPNQFVLKTNHGSGEVIIVKDKSKLDVKQVKKTLRKFLKRKFGIYTAEPHYLKIKPCVIAEELLIQDGNISSSPIDYKFFCFYGEPVGCGVFYNRNIETLTNSMIPYDMSWKKRIEWKKNSLSNNSIEIPKPHNFELMKKICKDLASQLPFVRLDLYEIDGKVYFGEFTFTPAALSGGSFSKEVMLEWGNYLDLDKIKKQDEI